MLKISKQKALTRWDNLPMILREAIFSERNADILWNICENQNLSDDKIEKVATLAGDVILGFLHSEDLAQEIGKDINVVPEIANAIASEIDRKIFSPIKNDLEKVYALLLEDADLNRLENEFTQTEEAEVLDLRVKDHEKPIVETESEKMEEPKIIPVEEKKEIKPEEIQYPEQKTQINAEIQREFAFGQRESAFSEDKPLIIHKETELKSPSDTQKSLKSLGGLFGILKKKNKTEEIKPVKAEVEGIEIKSMKIEEIKPAETKIKVVNYTETEIIKPTETEIIKPTETEIIKSEKTEINKEQKPLKESTPPAKQEEEIIDLNKL